MSERSTPGSHAAKGSGLTPSGTYQIFLTRSHLAPRALALSLCEKGTSSSVRMAAPLCGLWCMCSKDTPALGVWSLNEHFDRPRSRGAFWRGRAVKQIGKQMVSFWSVERQPCQKLDGFGFRRRRMNTLVAPRQKTAGRLPKTRQGLEPPPTRVLSSRHGVLYRFT